MITVNIREAKEGQKGLVSPDASILGMQNDGM